MKKDLANRKTQKVSILPPKLSIGKIQTLPFTLSPSINQGRI